MKKHFFASLCAVSLICSGQSMTASMSSFKELYDTYAPSQKQVAIGLGASVAAATMLLGGISMAKQFVKDQHNKDMAILEQKMIWSSPELSILMAEKKLSEITMDFVARYETEQFAFYAAFNALHQLKLDLDLYARRLDLALKNMWFFTGKALALIKEAESFIDRINKVALTIKNSPIYKEELEKMDKDWHEHCEYQLAIEQARHDGPAIAFQNNQCLE